ncbi:hypothetical protein ACTMTF_14560 [Nonomuraea sp. ZG12]|uniref:hypothetical protein n=1 Tax=Nonomuraea sp. ZG12 TaxID=3452207 RepID=UPI003F8C3C8A
MSEVVPLPSFGEVFFDARGQERCLRVTWHEGTLVLSLWRGEMCTASFRMPMNDVGRLLDTLDEGFAEASGEQPAVPDQEAGTEVFPGTGQYQRPPNPVQPPQDERPTAALAPNDVLVARGTPPPPQDKLVASYSETTPPRGTPTPQRQPFTGPQYADQGGGDRYGAPQPYADPSPAEPFSGPQYTDSGYSDPLSGPQYVQPPPPAVPFTGPQYVEEQHASAGQPVYQMPDDKRRQAPLTTDPLGFPSQAAEPFHSGETYAAPQPEPFPSRQPDPYGGQDQHYRQQPPPQSPPPAGAAATPGLGTPMHGIPGAGRRHDPFHGSPEATYGQSPTYGQDPYGPADNRTPPNPVDPLLALGQQAEPYRGPEGDLSRPYVGDPMFSTGERLRPDQQYDDRSDRREW